MNHNPSVTKAIACYAALRALGMSHDHSRAIARQYVTAPAMSQRDGIATGLIALAYPLNPNTSTHGL